MTLSSAEIDAMRATAEAILPDTCTIGLMAETVDAIGAPTYGTATTYSAVPCLVAKAPLSSRSGGEGGQYKVYNVWTISLHWDQPIAIGARVTYASDTYQVVDVDDNQGYRILRQAQMVNANA